MLIHLYITLSPSYLDSHIKRHILEAAKTQYENTSIMEIGHIISINRLARIIELSINKITNDVCVSAEYDVEVCKPEVGKVITGCQVHLLMNHGIFVKYHNIDILIPSASLQNYTFDHVKKHFIHKTSKHIISTDSSIDLTITDFRYNNGKFSCIADIRI